MKLTILVGTVSDTAWYVAQAVEQALRSTAAPGHALEIELLLADAQCTGELLEQISAQGLLLVCTSTHGSGEVPENLQPLYADLDMRPRYLGALRYGVIALGDQFYGETFAAGGRLFDARLQDLGAQRIGQLLVLDASDPADPEEQAAAWAPGWLQQARATLGDGLA
ncbi:flavodoxin domain-containing protein [Vandammella animalimorsus]|uniref:Nitric oxide synthase n=1 Tax=Vandammella animalimorsus TaxID=2029117 RepID=A0A2A2AL14_9BURK|nr:flavodoxin domain-containing protein [Vandammella animalimorsus]PAT38423.1 nitric oxide synthase [Vandammella animalimorsus]